MKPLYVGKLPEALRQAARGERDPFAARLDPADRADPEAEAFREEMGEIVRDAARALVCRDEAGAFVLALEDGSAEYSLRASATEIAIAFRSPRAIAPAGEEGLRTALREAIRISDDLPGEGLTLDDARFDRGVVYAIYGVSPVALGGMVKRIVAWSDGNLLLAGLRRRE